MTRIYMLAISLLVILQATCFGLERVTDSEKRLSLEPAQEWSVETNPQQGILLMLRGPEDSGANINFILERGVSISMDDYEKLSETNAGRDTEMFDFTILSRESVQIGGVDARSWVYTAKVGKDKTPIKCKVTFVIKDNNAYVITCGVLEDKFDQSSASFDSMLASIIWEKTPPEIKLAPAGKPTRVKDKTKVLSALMPAGWKSDPKPPQGAIMLLTCPPSTYSISILTEAVGGASLAAYEKASEQNASGGDDGFKIESKATVLIGGTRASKWIYTASYGEHKVPMKCMVLLMLRKKTAYTVTMGSVESQFNEARPTFDAFMKSITWIK